MCYQETFNMICDTLQEKKLYAFLQNKYILLLHTYKLYCNDGNKTFKGP